MKWYAWNLLQRNTGGGGEGIDEIQAAMFWKSLKMGDEYIGFITVSLLLYMSKSLHNRKFKAVSTKRGNAIKTKILTVYFKIIFGLREWTQEKRSEEKNVKPTSLLVSLTELYSSNRSTSGEQQGNRNTCTCFSVFIFRWRTHPTWAAHELLGGQPWVADPGSEHPRVPAEMGPRSRQVPVLGKASRKNSKCAGTTGVTHPPLSPGFGLLREASLGCWFSSVWGCI